MSLPPLPEAIARLSAYIARRKRARGIHIDDIHGFDAGPDCGIFLRLSDIEAAVRAVQGESCSLPAPALGASLTGPGSSPFGPSPSVSVPRTPIPSALDIECMARAAGGACMVPASDVHPAEFVMTTEDLARFFAMASTTGDGLANCLPPLPEVSDEDKQFLHYNPNTSDVLEWIGNYATAYAEAAVRAARGIDRPAGLETRSGSTPKAQEPGAEGTRPTKEQR